MPDFWQFPTVSMGLGPMMAIYQARFLKYLHGRGLADTEGRKVWAFLGDGETDEPESLGAISLAGRERLDNLIFVINCNLQRLDGPVRGNGKIIQELEGDLPRRRLERHQGDLGLGLGPADRQRHHRHAAASAWRNASTASTRTSSPRTAPTCASISSASIPRLKAMVADMIGRRDLGADPRRPRSAARSTPPTRPRSKHKGQPTVILAKTVKGYGMGEAGEGQNITHQQKKMGEAQLRSSATASACRSPTSSSKEMPFIRFAEGSAGAGLPARAPRRRSAATCRRAGASPSRWRCRRSSAFECQLKGTEGREISTTMAFVRMLNTLLRDKAIGKRVVPIVPDESRTFGMEGMFRQFGIFSQVGQLYRPEDANQLMFYKEDKNGQILQEGINEPGAMSSWIAAATSLLRRATCR